MPWRGFEPRRLSALPPQDSVSTSFTTRAGAGKIASRPVPGQQPSEHSRRRKGTSCNRRTVDRDADLIRPSDPGAKVALYVPSPLSVTATEPASYVMATTSPPRLSEIVVGVLGSHGDRRGEQEVPRHVRRRVRGIGRSGAHRARERTPRHVGAVHPHTNLIGARRDRRVAECVIAATRLAHGPTGSVRATHRYRDLVSRARDRIVGSVAQADRDLSRRRRPFQVRPERCSTMPPVVRRSRSPSRSDPRSCLRPSPKRRGRPVRWS